MPAWQAWLAAQWARPRPGWGVQWLRPLSWLYRLIFVAHRALYRLGLRRVRRAPRPLIVVGNLVAGGAGKTPAVIAIVQWLTVQGHRPGVISRGHGRRHVDTVLEVDAGSTAAEVGDEPWLIRRRTGAPVCVAADRWRAAQRLCATHPDVDVLVADDGLQHHALARDVDVLVFDARGVGNGLLLPAGPLRQPMPAHVALKTLVLYNAGQASTSLPGYLGRRGLGGVVELAAWWQGQAPSLVALQALRGRRLLAAAGLAQPEGFFAMLAQAGLTIDRLPLPDHHPYDSLPWPAATPDVIVTEKDAAKLRPEQVGATRVWVAALDFEPDPAFGPALLRLLAPAPAP